MNEDYNNHNSGRGGGRYNDGDTNAADRPSDSSDDSIKILD